MEPTITKKLGEFLGRAPMDSVRAMPMGEVPGFYLDVVFVSGGFSILLTATSVDLPDRTEAFILAANASEPDDGWKGPDGDQVWEPEDLLSAFGQTRAGDIWNSRRRVRFFLDLEDRARGLTAQGPFDSAVAIEFVTEDQLSPRVVLYATPEYPCSLEMTVSPERCNEILGSLYEFVPGTMTAAPAGEDEREVV